MRMDLSPAFGACTDWHWSTSSARCGAILHLRNSLGRRGSRPRTSATPGLDSTLPGPRRALESHPRARSGSLARGFRPTAPCPSISARARPSRAHSCTAAVPDADPNARRAALGLGELLAGEGRGCAGGHVRRTDGGGGQRDWVTAVPDVRMKDQRIFCRRQHISPVELEVMS